jgi:hypothetical protein
MIYPDALNREERKEKIARDCIKHGCSTKIAPYHYKQLVERDWDPHYSDDFAQWWDKHSDGPSGIGVKTRVAWNTQRYRDQFTAEQMQYGL